MRVVHIVPGAGGTFYCQNCMRDSALVRSLRQRGVDVMMVPLYLPLLADSEDLSGETPVFFGGINVYLQQEVKLFRKTPRWLDKLFDSPWMLRQAAAREGSTSAAELGPMTLSMLQGRDGHQRKEVDRLTAWLNEQEKPDLIHISNSLLLGVAREIKRALDVPVVCSLQDEDTWLDAMVDPWGKRCWEVMSEKARDVDSFVAVSEWYAEQMTSRMNIPRERITVVPVGIDLNGIAPVTHAVYPPSIGYLSRMSETLGLGMLADAFIQLKRDTRLKDLRLRITGGQTAEDKTFLEALRNKFRQEGVAEHVQFLDDFRNEARREFLHSLSVLSVPATGGEAFGLFILEALAYGVPVVQPAAGGFPELINATGGGITYDANQPDALAQSLAKLLLDSEHARELGVRGREAVAKDYNIENTTKQMMAVYNGCLR